MTKLYLDTSNNLNTLIRLDDQEYRFTYTSPREQDVFGALLKALKTHQIDIHDLSDISVCTGPGSFTGIRVGICIAQALSLALNLPINNSPAGSTITPNYGQEPSISTPDK